MKRALVGGAHSMREACGGGLASSSGRQRSPLLLQHQQRQHKLGSNLSPLAGARPYAGGRVPSLGSPWLSTTPLLRAQLSSSSGLVAAATRLPEINLHLHLHLNRRHLSSVHARGQSEAAQEMSKKAAGYEAKAAQALADGNLAVAGDSLMRSLEYVQRMIKDEANFEQQRDALFDRLANGMKRLGSIYLRQSRHQEAVLVLDKALKLRERDFERYKELEAAAKAGQSALPNAGEWEETHMQKQRKRAQAENLIDYSFTMTLLARAKLQHLQAIKRRYKHENASEEEKTLFLHTAEETAQNLETAKFLLSTSIIDDAIRSYTTFLPDANAASPSQESDFLEQAISAENKKEKLNPEAKELNSLGFWRGNLLEQKLLQAKIENAIQRAQLQTAAGQPDQALKILVASLRDSSSVFENYLEGLSSLSSPVVARLICHIVEARRDLLKEREKPQEIRDDEGEEEVGWIITNSKVSDFLSKGDILLGQAMQALRHRHDSFEGAPSELRQFESLALWESEEALARCLYNQGILALMRDRYYHNVGEFFHITLPEPELEDEARIDDLVSALVGSDGLLGEDALWEAYQLRKKFYGNSATHVEVLKCLLPLVRAYNQQGEKHQQVINLLEPVIAELESKQEQASASRVTTEDKSEWLAKCLNLLAEAEQQAEKHEQSEKHRLKALHILKRTRGPHAYETVQALRSLAEGFVEHERYPEAEKLLKAVLKSWKQGAEQGLDMTYELMDVLHDLGTIQAELKRPAEAEESFKLAVELAQSGLSDAKKGRERTKLPEANGPTLINTMGWFLYTERKPKEARPLLEKGYEALERKERIIKKVESKVKQLYEEMNQLERQDAEAYQQDVQEEQRDRARNDASATLAHLEEQQKAVLESLNANREMNARQLLNNLDALVEISMMEDQLDKSVEYAKRGVEVLEELIARGAAEQVELAEPLDDLAHALQKLGKTDEAAKAMERSLALQQKYKM